MLATAGKRCEDELGGIRGLDRLLRRRELDLFDFWPVGLQPENVDGNADGDREQKQNQPKRMQDDPNAQPDRCPKEEKRTRLLADRNTPARLIIMNIRPAESVRQQPIVKAF